MPTVSATTGGHRGTYDVRARRMHGRRKMVKCIGLERLLEDVTDIILGPQQKLLPKRRRIEASAETQWLEFGRILG